MKRFLIIILEVGVVLIFLFGVIWTIFASTGICKSASCTVQTIQRSTASYITRNEKWETYCESHPTSSCPMICKVVKNLYEPIPCPANGPCTATMLPTPDMCVSLLRS